MPFVFHHEFDQNLVLFCICFSPETKLKTLTLAFSSLQFGLNGPGHHQTNSDSLKDSNSAEFHYPFSEFGKKNPPRGPRGGGEAFLPTLTDITILMTREPEQQLQTVLQKCIVKLFTSLISKSKMLKF